MRRLSVWAVLLVLAVPLSAQSLLYRSPNLGGTWVADGGVVQFNFLHRFIVADPGNQVYNAPTFTLGAGLGYRVMLGWHFSTKSFPVNGNTNESELSARWRILGASEMAPGLSLAVTPAYNLHAKSFDGEVSAQYTAGRVTLEGAVRQISKPFGASGDAKAALAGGATLRLNDYIALSGDYATLLSGDTTAAWSAALNFAIPGTPHTFSLQTSNVAVNSIRGSSVGFELGGYKRFYGFEFTIPLHLSRFGAWFKRAPAAASAAAGPGVAVVEISAFKFPETLTIQAGQTVRWVNRDPVEHTITFDQADIASPPIGQGGAFSHTFTQAGTYTYHCTPHPFMKGVIVVQ